MHAQSHAQPPLWTFGPLLSAATPRAFTHDSLRVHVRRCTPWEAWDAARWPMAACSHPLTFLEHDKVQPACGSGMAVSRAVLRHAQGASAAEAEPDVKPHIAQKAGS